MPNLPSGTVTFVFSDLEGSSQTLRDAGALTDEQYARAVDRAIEGAD